ncbi:hypothetical protein [Saccharopolyspora sp. NPDC002686]|uniref:hypothetical protein n=1 Tax=Saccharopolyspora sp. NPDC002686 TaxID=3154541 RepID=UPI0033248755
MIGASAHQLAPTDSDELVTQLNRAQRWITWWGWATVACALISFSTPLFLIPTAVALVVALVGFARRRVVLHYEVDSDLAKWFNSLAAGWSSLVQTNGKWRVQTSTHLNRTHDRKMHAGAGNLVSRHDVSFLMKLPMALNANVKVPTVKAKRHNLLFLPDRLLVKSGGRWSDVDYNHLKVSVAQSRFIEDGVVPRDGVQVDETWQYANVRGGPDRRFKNNRRLPVMLYSEVMLSSPQGLVWVVKLSRHDAATWWQQILRSRPRTPLLTSTPLPDAPAASAGPAPTPIRSSAKESTTIIAQSGPVTPASAPAPRRASKPESEHVPPSPAGRPIEPWGRPWNTIEVVGESFHEKAIAALFTGVPGYKEPGGAELEEKAVMVPDPDNPHGEGHAVAVFVRGQHVGYVPHEESTVYFPHVSAMTAGGSAVTVDARVWACTNYQGSGFRGRVTLSVAEAEDFGYPASMPDDDNAILLPVGNALQVTGEEEHVDFLRPYVGESVAVTLHNVTIEKAGKPLDLVEIRLDGEAVGRFIPRTSAKVGPLVSHVESVGGLPVARASVTGNALKADVTVYVARAGDVPQSWIGNLRPII